MECKRFQKSGKNINGGNYTSRDIADAVSKSISCHFKALFAYTKDYCHAITADINKITTKSNLC